AGPARHPGVLVAHRTHARPRRRDDHITPTPFEHLDVLADQVERLREIPGVDVHLAATGLLLRENDLVTETLDKLDRGDRGPGEQRVSEAGDQQRDTQSGSSRVFRFGEPNPAGPGAVSVGLRTGGPVRSVTDAAGTDPCDSAVDTAEFD